jgi:phenylalanyl-tRNA synthetase beta chain
MKFSRDWLTDYIDLSGLSDEALGTRFTEIGHAVESVEGHGNDTVFDLEITTNRVDAMSHLGMARELAAALGRDLRPSPGASRHPLPRAGEGSHVQIRIDAPDMCSRYTGLVIRGVKVGPSPDKVRRRLEAVGLRSINNVVDATNYVMMAVGHPLHAFDLDKLAGRTIIVRRGSKGETMRSLDGENRAIDPETVVIADAKHAVALGGIIGGAESEIGQSTTNVLLECAWFNPSVVRRTARRLGIKTDASYRFERRVDPNDTVSAALMTASLIVESAGGTAETPIDVVATRLEPKTLRLRNDRLKAASDGVIPSDFALKLFLRLGFETTSTPEGTMVVVPTFRGDIAEETDLIEEVLRFYGLNKIPASLPRVTVGDAKANVIGDAEDATRQIMTGSGLTEVVNYSFIHPDYNALFTDEKQIALTNALSENVGAMRLSLIPGLLETVVYNRSYGTRDGSLFEVGRTYHRSGDQVTERHRVAAVMFGHVDFFDIKGIVEQLAAKFHVPLSFATSEEGWLRKGKRAVARHGERTIASLGFVATEILQRFAIKGDVVAAEIDLEGLLASAGEWKITQVARFPGVPMILAMTHSPDLAYQQVIDTIRSLNVPNLHEVGLRDRFVPEGEAGVVKTTLGMWYQAFDRSLTQEEVGQAHQGLAARVASMLPVTLITQEKP